MAKLVVGKNDLFTVNPELAKQWHPTMNDGRTPHNVTAGASRKVWWQCVLGHEWEALISSRTSGRGCPVCAGKSVWFGYNDLFTNNPMLAGEWHPTKNGDLTPKDVTQWSSQKVHWVCREGHSWESMVKHRSHGSGCPTCDGKRIQLGYNDLFTNKPMLAGEWHPTKNGDLTPKNVHFGSNKGVWWMCAYNHEWKASVFRRSNGVGCPYCAGRLLTGVNDLFTKNPKLAGEWHPTKNGDLTPKNVTVSSDKKAWWICSLGHEWKTQVSGRTSGSGCPVCSGRSVLFGYNDLFTNNPMLAGEWHPTKNGDLTPKDVTVSSDKKVWWICSLGHEWKTNIKSRSKGGGCKYCIGGFLLAGFNDLFTKNPKLAGEWHPTKNGDLTPYSVTQWSSKKAYWMCAFGHEWEARISSRVGGNGCSQCCFGVTEGKFRQAFQIFTGSDFASNRIDLIRKSRPSDRAQIDMLNNDLKLVIEYDGAWTHGDNVLFKHTLEQKLADDKETTEALVDNGYDVIRIRNHDASQKLPFVPLDPEYESNVFQITYKSFGKDKDDIEELVQKIIEEKADWFKVSSELMLTS